MVEQAELDAAKDEIATLKAEIERLRAENDRLSQLAASLQAERDAALAEASRLRQQLDEAEAATAALQRELADLKKKMEALQVSIFSVESLSLARLLRLHRFIRSFSYFLHQNHTFCTKKHFVNRPSEGARLCIRGMTHWVVTGVYHLK